MGYAFGMGTDSCSDADEYPLSLPADIRGVLSST